MSQLTRRRLLKLAVGASAAATLAPRTLLAENDATDAKAPRPNIVFIFADDMGYGDPHCFNDQSKCPTPNIDRLAAEGMKFTDAHAPVSWCVPSRYGLITGRYPFRADHYQLKDDDATIATVVKSAGYRTAMVGKWHLGFRRANGSSGPKALSKVRTGERLLAGPTDRGFDKYFGIWASLDIPPYFFVENGKVVAAPTEHIETSHSPGVRSIQGAFYRGGAIAPGFKHEHVLPECGRKAMVMLDAHHASHADQPLLLYLALPSPHTPWLPEDKYKGKSKCGDYGDYVAEVDGIVGEVLVRLDKLGMTKNTLVLFTSDNGPVWYAEDVKKYGHSSVGPLRGMKADAWEGGNRLPFIARWPGHVKPGSTCDSTICFTDMMATFAELAGAKLGRAGEDSFSIVPLLDGDPESFGRKVTILQAGNRMFAVRRGNWKLILGRGGGGFSPKVKPGPNTPPGQLYDLSADIGEQKNLYNERPKIVAELTALLDKARKADRTAPAR